jgi:site-specific DNA-methyltransferase (adenine-specific)
VTTILNQIVVSDALEFVQALPDGSVPLYLFSPPYNLGNSSGGGIRGATKVGHYSADAGYAKRGGGGKWHGGDLANGYTANDDNLPWPDYIARQQSILRECWRTLPENGAIYYNHKERVQHGVLIDPMLFVPDCCILRQRIIWARAGGVNFNEASYCSTHEVILILAKPDFRLKSKGASGAGSVWYIPQLSNTWHPAPFPLALAARVIETTMPPLICDIFAGSGTTAKAARKYGVDFIGCDNSAVYVERANRELALVQPIAPVFLEQQSVFEVLT